MIWLVSLCVIFLIAVGPIIPLLVLNLIGDTRANTPWGQLAGTLPWTLYFSVPAGAVLFLVWLLAWCLSFFFNG